MVVMSTVRHRVVIWATYAVLLSAVVWATYEVAERIGIRSLREATMHRMDIYSASLQAEMKRFEYLPPVLALNEQIIALLERPDDRSAQANANAYLKTVGSRAGAAAIYLMDRNGMTLAASNWDEPGSFVGMNFAYRPYFQDAVGGAPGRFYGIGTVSREAGYYFSEAVNKRSVLGVAAVKVNLEKLDDVWGHDGEKIVVADGNGVIFLSSEPNWKYRTLSALSVETKGRLAATRQYTEAGLLSPLGVSEQRVLDDGSVIMRVQAEPIERQKSNASVDYLVHGKAVPGTHWRLLVMSDLSSVRAAARDSAASAAGACVLLAMLFLYFRERRRIVAEKLSARAALERANNELERTVERRTLDLRNANGQLQAEIAERRRAEEALRATLGELVHTAKMAVLGQMSAGITHELNQPLTALRTLSSNTIFFLEHGEEQKVKANLEMIAHLTDHMGKVTAQLKKFARKSAVDLQPVLVASVVSDALFLIGQSVHIANLQIDKRVEPPDVMAVCDANRLEQVLLNLLSNAADAVSDVDDPRIMLRVTGDDDWVCIELHDNGPGVEEHVFPRLFEPFFSTKEQGAGLGLGLAISADIVRGLGGTLAATSSELLGGALFTVRLRAAAVELAHA